jgi:hypothetical protein
MINKNPHYSNKKLKNMLIVFSMDAFETKVREDYANAFIDELTKTLEKQGLRTTVKKQSVMDLDPISQRDVMRYDTVMFMWVSKILVNEYGYVINVAFKMQGFDVKRDQNIFKGSVVVIKKDKKEVFSKLVELLKEARLL